MLARRQIAADAVRSQPSSKDPPRPTIVYKQKQPSVDAHAKQPAKSPTPTAATNNTTTKAIAILSRLLSPQTKPQQDVFIFGASHWLTTPLSSSKPKTKTKTGTNTPDRNLNSKSHPTNSSSTAVPSSPPKRCVCANRFKTLARGARGVRGGRACRVCCVEGDELDFLGGGGGGGGVEGVKGVYRGWEWV